MGIELKSVKIKDLHKLGKIIEYGLVQGSPITGIDWTGVRLHMNMMPFDKNGLRKKQIKPTKINPEWWEAAKTQAEELGLCFERKGNKAFVFECSI